MAGLTVVLAPPSFDLKVHFLREKAQELDLNIRHSLVDVIANATDSNLGELENALVRLAMRSKSKATPITLDMVQEEFLSGRRRRKLHASIGEILSLVGDYYDVSVAELRSLRGSTRQPLARPIAIYLCRDLTMASPLEIADRFNEADGTPIMNWVHKVEELRKVDPKLNSDIDLLHRVLTA